MPPRLPPPPLPPPPSSQPVLGVVVPGWRAAVETGEVRGEPSTAAAGGGRWIRCPCASWVRGLGTAPLLGSLLGFPWFHRVPRRILPAWKSIQPRCCGCGGDAARFGLPRGCLPTAPPRRFWSFCYAHSCPASSSISASLSICDLSLALLSFPDPTTVFSFCVLQCHLPQFRSSKKSLTGEMAQRIKACAAKPYDPSAQSWEPHDRV